MSSGWTYLSFCSFENQFYVYYLFLSLWDIRQFILFLCMTRRIVTILLVMCTSWLLRELVNCTSNDLSHFNGRFRDEPGLASSPPWFPSFICSKRELWEYSAQVLLWVRCPLVTQPTVSKHWKELKVLTPATETCPLALSIIDPLPDSWGRLLAASLWCQYSIPLITSFFWFQVLC